MLTRTRSRILFLYAFTVILAFAFQTQFLAVSINSAEALVPVPAAVALPLEIIEVTDDASIVEETAAARTIVAASEVLKKIPSPIAEPVGIEIPSIGLDSRVIPVGVNAAGEMSVPDGDTHDIGWFKEGPKPGQIGSAVFDAHVYAAFSNLNDVKVGEDVYVVTETGKKLQFEVIEREIYALNDLSPATLFKRKDARRLNLITCAGKPTADGSTYTHRLVVYTKFVGEVA